MLVTESSREIRTGIPVIEAKAEAIRRT
ncbi:hypothetical protein A2U01_0087961, partial [Trifolium medium]|nr:hypothetical protein [Trifolium medium]